MNYLYDIWVNWFDGEESGFNICPYYEWRKDDKIEMIDQIPVLYITKRLYHYIENGLASLPPSLLKDVYKKSYIRKGYGRKVMKYASIVTDGEHVLAFDTTNYEMPFRKSRLIPRQERQVVEMCSKLDRMLYKIPQRNAFRENGQQTKLTVQHIVGLTRRERKLKQLLFSCLANLQKSDNKQEMSYWLSEWQGVNALPYTRTLSSDEIWTRLYKQISVGWSSAHERFLRQIVPSYPHIQEEWEQEVRPQKNKENQK